MSIFNFSSIIPTCLNFSSDTFTFFFTLKLSSFFHIKLLSFDFLLFNSFFTFLSISNAKDLFFYMSNFLFRLKSYSRFKFFRNSSGLNDRTRFSVGATSKLLNRFWCNCDTFILYRGFKKLSLLYWVLRDYNFSSS